MSGDEDYPIWYESKLSGADMIIITSYAAGQSAYNMIEHAWSPLSNRLTSVKLPAILEGEEKPPNKQTNLTEEERIEEEGDVEPESDEDIDDDDCNARPCIIDGLVKNKKTKVAWVRCCACLKWFHQYCVGVADDDLTFKCPKH